jgi:DNA-binding transcriptional MerR regulator
MMTIGELSSRTGVSVKILRRYDSQGLLYSAGGSLATCRAVAEHAQLIRPGSKERRL